MCSHWLLVGKRKPTVIICYHNYNNKLPLKVMGSPYMKAVSLKWETTQSHLLNFTGLSGGYSGGWCHVCLMIWSLEAVHHNRVSVETVVLFVHKIIHIKILAWVSISMYLLKFLSLKVWGHSLTLVLLFSLS